MKSKKHADSEKQQIFVTFGQNTTVSQLQKSVVEGHLDGLPDELRFISADGNLIGLVVRDENDQRLFALTIDKDGSVYFSVNEAVFENTWTREGFQSKSGVTETLFCASTKK